MGRSIAIKLAILLVVAALVYSVFWFFKVGQVEKQLNKFVSDNSSYISAGEITVSGFPLSQKITIKNLKFTIPTAALDKNDVIVPHLEATAGIMASDYVVSLIDPVSVQDADGNISNVEFTTKPEITLSIAGGEISKFHYQDMGYKILAADKSTAYAASSTDVSINSTFELEKTTHTISTNIKEIQGFDIISLYKNVLEKRVVDGLKTGEITLGNNPQIADPNTATPTPTTAASAPTTPLAPTPAAPTAPVLAAPVTPAAPVAPVIQTAPTSPTTAAVPVTAPAPLAPAAPVPAPVATANPPVPAVATVNPAAPTPVPTQPMTVEATTANPVAVPTAPAPDLNNVKSDFTLTVEYILTPAQAEGQQANTPPDPTQIQEAPSSFNKSVKITNLEFSNSLYTISLTGELSLSPEDNFPSGSISIKTDKIDALVSQISTNFAQTVAKLKPAAELHPAAELMSGTAAAPTPIAEDPYQTFLARVAANLGAVAKEIAAKNAVSKDNVAQFDIRREKNLDFLINETPIREILGKF